ncbi:alcohol acetyltransferase [Terfezia claveryi]|nr:alcohol acetyltransferase [Terfezia claveryi]
MEQYCTHRHHLNYYTCVVTSAFYIRRAPGSNVNPPPPADHQSLQSLIYSALHNLIRQHPMLSVTVVDEHTSKPYYSALTKVDLDKTVHILPLKRDIDEIVQDVLCQDFKQQMQAGGPCWRVVVVPGVVDKVSGFWVVFAFHHALADGLGGFVFHKHLLHFLNSGSLDLESPISPTVEVQTPKQLTPAMEHMHKLPLGLGYLLKAIRDEYLPFTTTSPSNLWICGDPGSPLYFPPPPAGLRTELVTVRIPTEVMRGVLTETKEKRTRVTPLLEAILSLAFLEVFPQCDNIRVSIIVSVRRWLTKQLEPYGGADNVFGLYVTQFSEDFTMAGFDLSKPLPSIYSEAQRARETIDKVLLSYGKNTEGGLLRFVANFDSYFRSKIGQRRVYSLELSNVGVFKTGAVPNKDKWDIGDVRFSQSASVTGAAVECNIVSLESGAMALGFTWQEGIVSKEAMEKVLERVRVLLELVGGRGVVQNETMVD